MAARLTPYRPAKGDEGGAFYASLCAHCRRDMSESQPCRLLIRGLLLKGRQLFPRDWVLSDGEPSCTAFSPIGGPRRQGPPAASAPAPHQAQAPQMELAL